MKRVVIVAALMALSVWVSVYSIVYVNETGERVLGHVERSECLLAAGSPEQLSKELNDLAAFWFEREKVLAHFIRHNQLDGVNVSMARLPALAAAGDYAEVAAELAGIRWQIDHLKDSETLAVDNLF